ncbi:MAG: alpha/beta hydrolase [Deltaproteobacteria bacterium]|jgi:pimeloyl-ACP methyl ester carboxylesterase|nr:alpha/beta hydrolase [Deltaproteobacteria bacterium]
MYIQINGVKLYYDKIGSGPPLVLAHGNSDNHHIFDTLSLKLTKHFTMYLLDSRDHGLSEKTGAWSYEAMAADLDGFIAALGLEPVNFLGFSDGAIVGLLLGLRRPTALKRMALLGANLSPADFTEEAVVFLRQLGRKVNSPIFQMIFEEPHIELESLKNIPTPCLVVAGEKDLFKPEVTPAIANTLPNARLLIVKGHDHISYIVYNDLLYKDLLKFFRSSLTR